MGYHNDTPLPCVLTTEGNLKRLQWEEKEMAQRIQELKYELGEAQLFKELLDKKIKTLET